jgi:hypothetical protein
VGTLIDIANRYHYVGRMFRLPVRPWFLRSWLQVGALALWVACGDDTASTAEDSGRPTDAPTDGERDGGTRQDKDSGTQQGKDSGRPEERDSAAPDDADSGMPAAGDDGAVLVSAFVRSADSYNVYVGATRGVPTGKVDYTRWIEFSDAIPYTANGFVYVWDLESATLTQFVVQDDLQLEQGPVVSFLDYGLAGGGSPVFISKDRAYMLSRALDVIVIFDPTKMEITGSMEIQPPERPMLDLQVQSGVLFGDSVIWPIGANSQESQTIDRGVTLLVADAKSDAAPKYIEDERCAGGDSLHFTGKPGSGDLYVLANAYWGVFAAYEQDVASVRTCMLRVKSGTREFDKGYMLDLKELTGSYINGPWFHVTGTQFVAHVWDKDVPLPEIADDFWNLEGYKPWLVDIEKRTAERYTDLDKGIVQSNIEFEVDGVAYYPLSELGSAEGAQTRVVALHPDGARETFTIPELWGLARIR